MLILKLTWSFYFFQLDVLGNSLRSDIDLSSESMLGVSSVQNDLANSYLSDSELTTYLNDVQRENGKIAAATNQTADNLPETVAINLIKSFTSLERSFKPDPNQIEWLVSEEQAPQKLLPLPSKVLLANEQIARSASLLPFSGDSVNITCKSSPSYAKSDKCFESNECTPLDKPIKLRGNEEWAPPRPQLIFHVHTPIKRNLALVKQNFRCAGCGMKVDKAYISRMLYCHYTAKYFCQYGCHSGARHVLPAYIINRWDFRAFYVSNFANQFLERIMFEPLFNIQDLNPNLYKKRKQFRSFTELKLQLIALKDYVYSCKRTGSLVISFLLLEPRHVLNKDLVNYFSLHDLIEIKRNSDFLPKLVRLVSDSKTHVLQCDVCCAKGFLCELCNNSSVNRSTNDIDLLFPFEIGRVRQCFACNSCYHDNCIKQNDFRCTKCIRINHRKLKSTQS